MRRHRANTDYLRSIAKRVSAHASLALVLLGLAPAVVHAAGAPVFDPFDLGYDPFAPASGFKSKPALGDLDGDGDLDVVAGTGNGSFRYLINVGQPGGPLWADLTGASNPLNGQVVPGAFDSSPALVDLDGDGDLDVVAGSYAGTFQFYRNTGSSTAPAFSLATNPLAGRDVGSSSAPSFGDLDGDGDQDMVSGQLGFGYFYFENTGTATNPSFVERTGAANPLGTLAGADISSPALGDADRDGDLDLIVGTASGVFLYFENSGSARRPIFRPLQQRANPLRDEILPGGNQFATPALGDVDADGDLDVVSGMGSGAFTAFVNQSGQLVKSNDIAPATITGLGFPFNAVQPGVDFDGDGDVEIIGTNGTFARNTGTQNDPAYAAPAPFPGFGGTVLSPVDLDGDGDFDGVSGGLWYMNSGSASSPSFVAGPTLFPPTLPGGFSISVATFGDLDLDGDQDASVPYQTAPSPSQIGTTRYYENIGTTSVPIFVERSGASNLLPPTDADIRLIDLDRDGDVDALSNLVTVSPYAPTYWENVGTVPPSFVARAFNERKNPLSKLLSNTPLAILITLVADLDGDGDPDTFGGSQSGASIAPYLLENGVVRPSPRYFGPSPIPFANLGLAAFSSPAAGDLDGDGDPDFVASRSFGDGAIHYYQNTGTARVPAVVERVGAANPFDGLVSSWTPILVLGDVDGDGDLDLLAGEAYGAPLRYFKNTGTATAPAFLNVVGPANPFDAVTIARSAPALGDVDQDGDLDLVIGGGPGNFRYFRNGGSATTPAYAEVTGASNPFDGLVAGVGFFSNPTLGDIDLDGDVDLVSGDETTGGFFSFENTGSARFPAFTSRTGAANPFDGRSVGLNSTPTLVDLDGDADLDLVSGNRAGQLQAFYSPEPRFAELLAAGLALLGWIGRSRGRSAKPKSPRHGRSE